MPRHSSARFRCAGPALRLFLLSVFLTPSAFGQSMWKPFEPEWLMTAPTAPSSTVAGTDADTAWLSAAWESGADDLNLSDLNRRFPLLQLAQELADAIEKAPPREHLLRFREIPEGLQMYVFWHLSTSTQSGIVRTGMQEMIARYPRQSATVASLEKKYLALLPLFEKVRRTGRMSGNVARAFKDSLKPAEKILASAIGDALFPGSLFMIYPTEAEISPAGWQWLSRMASTSPAARQFLTLPKAPDTESGTTRPSPEDATDGFFVIPQGDVQKNLVGCICNTNRECRGRLATCTPGGCYDHGYRQCSWWFWWIYCDGLCR